MDTHDGERVKVLLPLPFETAFDYLNPQDSPLIPGQFVRVPFRSRTVNGIIWPEYISAAHSISGTPKPEKPLKRMQLKAILHIYETTPLSAEMIDFIQWVADYTLHPLGNILRLVMRSGETLTPPAGLTTYKKAPTLPERLKITPQRQKVLNAAGNEAKSTAQLQEESGSSSHIIRSLAKAGALISEHLDPDPPFDLPNPALPGNTLSPAQSNAANALIEGIDKISGQSENEKPANTTTLLDGVTGSGKTEIYLEAIRETLSRDPSAQICILLPEIGLTLPFLKRVEERFGAAPAPWHSDINNAMRRRIWRRVIEGQARLVVGARSALFLPYKNLKLIIVDEEHDGAFKQEDGVTYQGRDMAVARGARARFPVILASATPALETVINAADGRYNKVSLPSRYGSAVLPDIDLIDLRKSPPEKLSGAASETSTQSTTQSTTKTPAWISPPLIDAINERLLRGEQSLLFLNRRGYAPLTICRKCGHRMTSPLSDTCLVEHRYNNRLVCHHTGYSIPKPNACPQCHTVGGLSACGPGVERIAAEASQRWPHARLAIFSSDQTNNETQVKTILDDMRDGNIDILVATQAAAKGHNFPNLTLVGVIDSDLGLSGGDLRAAERTYQLISQVTGRAGRATKPGQALLQTYRPDAPVLRALAEGNRDEFLAIEAQGRLDMRFPPFGRLAAIILQGPHEAELRDAAKTLRDNAPAHSKQSGIEIWGPAPAPIYRLNGKFRIRFLIRSKRSTNIQAFLKDWTDKIKIPNSIRRTIDIDPYNFM